MQSLPTLSCFLQPQPIDDASTLCDVQTLSNECARVCNQRRSKLGAKGQERVDEAFASLAPTFDVQVGRVAKWDIWNGEFVNRVERQ